MKWYDPLPCDNTVDDPYVAGEGDLRGFEEWVLGEGRAVTDWDTKAFVKATTPDDDGDPDDVLQTYLGLPIYSARLQRALRKADVDAGIQFLPIRVLQHDDTEIPGFAIANILNRVAALDFEHSKYTLFPADWIVPERRGDVWSILRPVLIRERLDGYHIVRLQECSSNLFVSQLVKDVFEDGGFTGYSFREVRLD